MYNIFGSGASHDFYVQFITQAAMHNKMKKVGLLRGAGTYMATWFYAMIGILRLKALLPVTIHQVQFRELNLNKRDRLAVMNIENDLY